MVAAFEKRMAESNRPKPVKESLKQPLITKDEVQYARVALSLIVHTDTKYAAQAQKLLDLIWNDEEEGERAMEAAAAKAVADDADGRKTYAKELERNFLSGGFDVTVSTSGPKATILTLRFCCLADPRSTISWLTRMVRRPTFLTNVERWVLQKSCLRMATTRHGLTHSKRRRVWAQQHKRQDPRMESKYS
jgi:hypothetical protein